MMKRLRADRLFPAKLVNNSQELIAQFTIQRKRDIEQQLRRSIKQLLVHTYTTVRSMPRNTTPEPSRPILIDAYYRVEIW